MRRLLLRKLLLAWGVVLWAAVGAAVRGHMGGVSELDRDMGEVWHSSEEAGEVSTSRRNRRAAYRLPEPPPGAFRLGCVCMDGTRADTRGIGACSGHGGVRYWVHRKREGDTLLLPTERHLKHPEALPAEKMMELSRKRADRTRRMEEGRGLDVGMGRRRRGHVGSRLFATLNDPSGVCASWPRTPRRSGCRPDATR